MRIGKADAFGMERAHLNHLPYLTQICNPCLWHGVKLRQC